MSLPIIADVANWISLTTLAIIAVFKTIDALKNSDVRKSIHSLVKASESISNTKKYLKVLEVMIYRSGPNKSIIDKIFLSYNSSLVASINIVAEKAFNSAGEEKKAKTIVGMMLGEKLEKSSRTQLFLISAIVIHIFIAFFFEIEFSSFALLIISISLVAIYVDHKLIEYRIKQGWYGTNEFESREIIDFILSHANKDDFNDQGGLKKVIPTLETPKEEHASNTGGVLV